MKNPFINIWALVICLVKRDLYLERWKASPLPPESNLFHVKLQSRVGSRFPLLVGIILGLGFLLLIINKVNVFIFIYIYIVISPFSSLLFIILPERKLWAYIYERRRIDSQSTLEFPTGYNSTKWMAQPKRLTLLINLLRRIRKKSSQCESETAHSC